MKVKSLQHFADFKKAIEDQWNEYDYTKYSPLTDVYIVMDKNATLASVLFGVTFEGRRAGITENLFIPSRSHFKETRWQMGNCLRAA